jgi:hypothetical protein
MPLWYFTPYPGLATAADDFTIGSEFTHKEYLSERAISHRKLYRFCPIKYVVVLQGDLYALVGYGHYQQSLWLDLLVR